MVSYDVTISVRNDRLFEAGILLLSLFAESLPLLFILQPFLLQLFLVHDPLQTLGVFISQSFIKGLIVDFIENGLQSIETFLEHFMPVLISEMNYHWN